MSINYKKSSLLILIILGICWSSFAAFTKIASEINPLLIVFWRVLIGAFALYIIFAIIKQQQINWLLIKNSSSRIFIVGLINMLIPYILFAIAAKKLDSIELSVIDGTIPFFEVLTAMIIFKKKPQKEVLFGIFLAFIGIILIACNQSSVVDIGIFDFWHLFFIILLLFATFSYAVGAIYINRYCSDIDSFTLSFGSSILILPILLPILFFVDFAMINKQQWLAIFGLGIICTGLANFFYFKLITEEGSRFATTSVLLIPIFGTLIGYFFLDESLDVFKIIGSILILLSIKFILQIKFSNF